MAKYFDGTTNKEVSFIQIFNKASRSNKTMWGLLAMQYKLRVTKCIEKQSKFLNKNLRSYPVVRLLLFNKLITENLLRIEKYVRIHQKLIKLTS